jgi:broad specificity phosphatase PhoE
VSSGTPQEAWLVRHGATDWSQSGRHTGRTDVPLNDEGRRQARALARRLAGRQFALVLTSPLQRAIETCRIAGYGDIADVEPDLREWDYGDYEGLTTVEIRRHDPDWTIWTGTVPGGETIDEVGARARRVVERVLAVRGDVALFAHGHILRVLAACWLGLTFDSGRLLGLDTATLSVLGYERETRVVRSWNEDAALLPVPL